MEAAGADLAGHPGPGRPRTAKDNALELGVRSRRITIPDTVEGAISWLSAVALATRRSYRARAALVRLGLTLPEAQQPEHPDGALVGLIEDYGEPDDGDPDKLEAHAELARIVDSGRWSRMDRAVVAAALDILLARDA